MGTGARLASRRRCRRGQIEQRAVGEVRGVRPDRKGGASGAHWLVMSVRTLWEVGLSAEGGLG